MDYIYLLIVSEIILLMISFIYNRDIMAPSVVMCLVFIFSTTVVILNVNNWNVHYSFKAYLLLITGIATFVFFDSLIAKIYFQKYSVNIRSIKINKNIKYLPDNILEVQNWKVVVLIFVALITLYLQYHETARIASTGGYFGSNIFYAYRMISSHSADLTADQYMSSKVTMLMKITTITGIVFTYIVINNVMIYRQKLRKNLKFIPIIICFIMQSILSGVRTNILRLIIFGVVAGYILWRQKNNWKKSGSWRVIKIFMIVICIVLPAFYYSKILLGRTDTLSFFNSISIYTGAPIQHFNQYIQDPPDKNVVFGQETLIGLQKSFMKLGLITVESTSHLEYRYLNDTEFGNVYTFFRRLIQDFGILGMYFITACISTLFSYVYNFKIKDRVYSYKTHKVIIIYSYCYYIVAMSSIDQFIHDYLNIGNMVMIFMFTFALWFYTQTFVSKYEIKFRRPEFFKT